MLMDAGPLQSDGMGQASLSWPTIHAWRDLTRTVVRPWEARLLRRASAAYLSELHAAEDHRRAPPWTVQVETRSERELAEARLRAVLG